MKHTTSIVLALFGLAAMAPAQLRVEGILGRHVKVGVQVGADRHDHRYDNRGPRARGHDNRGVGHRAPAPRQNGYWQTVYDQVFVPGYYRDEHVPARYGWIVDHCGRRVWGVVTPACTRQVWVPGHYETRARKVFVCR